jgi:hypothetical protein
MARYINDHLIIYDRVNNIISLLFEMELGPSEQALVTPAYIVECIFSDENYMFTESLLTSIGKRPGKTQTYERGASRVFNARDRNLCGITLKRILEHAPVRGDQAPSDPSTYEGKRFTKLYGVPWTLFIMMSDEFQQWCAIKGHHFNLKGELPFKLQIMECCLANENRWFNDTIRGRL